MVLPDASDLLGLSSARQAAAAGSTSATRGLAMQLLATLPAAELADVQSYLHSRLAFDLLTALPSELALQVLSHLDGPELLRVQGVCRAWRTLANDQTLWRGLCLHSRVAFHSSLTADEYARRRPQSGLHDAHWPTAFSGADVDEGTSLDALAATIADVRLASFQRDVAEVYAGLASSSGVQGEPYAGLSTLRHLLHALPPPPLSRAPPFSPALRDPTNLAFRLPNFKHLHLAARTLARRLASPTHALTRAVHGSASSLAAGGLAGHTGGVYCVALAPGGLAVTGGKDRTVRVWQLGEGGKDDGRVVCVLEGAHLGSVLTVCLLPSPPEGSGSAGEERGTGGEALRVVSGGGDGRLALWHLTPPSSSAPPAFSSFVSSASNARARSPEGWTSKLMSVKLGAHAESVFSVSALGPDRFVSCSKDRTLKIWRVGEGLEEECVLEGHRGAVNAVAAKGDVIVSASGDRTIRLWSAVRGEPLHVLPPLARGVSALDFDGQFIVSGSSDHQVRQFDLSPALDPPFPTSPFFPTPSTSLGSLDPTSQYVKAETYTRRSCCPSGACGCSSFVSGHSDLVRAIQMSKDFVVSAGYDQSVKIWERGTGLLVRDLRAGHTQRIFGVAFDAGKIVSAGQDGKLCVWRWDQGLDLAFLRS